MVSLLGTSEHQEIRTLGNMPCRCAHISVHVSKYRNTSIHTGGPNGREPGPLAYHSDRLWLWMEWPKKWWLSYERLSCLGVLDRFGSTSLARGSPVRTKDDQWKLPCRYAGPMTWISRSWPRRLFIFFAEALFDAQMWTAHVMFQVIDLNKTMWNNIH